LKQLRTRFSELLNNNNVNITFAISLFLLLFLGPVAKSAQFPLHVWLPDAMEGPTPIFSINSRSYNGGSWNFFSRTTITIISKLTYCYGYHRNN
jgi:hypothetical protein